MGWPKWGVTSEKASRPSQLNPQLQPSGSAPGEVPGEEGDRGGRARLFFVALDLKRYSSKQARGRGEGGFSSLLGGSGGECTLLLADFFPRQGDQILTASWVPRNALQLWDLRMSCLWHNLPFPGSATQGEFLYSARFCSGNVALAGGSGTSGASAIHTDSGQVRGGGVWGGGHALYC